MITRMRTVVTLLAGLAGVGLACDSGAGGSHEWVPRPVPTGAEFRGVAALPGGGVWLAGRGGVVAMSPTADAPWRVDTIPDARALFFVDVAAFDSIGAYVLGTSFDGGLARIYQTLDGGHHWRVVYEDARPGAFYDGMAFWDARRGVAFGDALGGRLTIVRTEDGTHWVPADSVPAALEGEGGFAASGTAIAVAGERHAWIGTGAGPSARVLRSDDGGRSWTAAETGLPAGPTAGIFGIAFRDTLNGVAVGGDYTDSTSVPGSLARTRDGGRTWRVLTSQSPPGVRYGVAYVPGTDPAMLVVVGPSGSAYSLNDGTTWKVVGRRGYNALGFSRTGAGWAAGVDGTAARWR